ncbi:sugar phosphate isomerase/epimerase [Candidatus Micrarchaeota archaeon]|jgi:protein FrlC|nr:sugar phosphate isomerase/epimerase [Candidatus Micrarchaeota archaeon]
MQKLRPPGSSEAVTKEKREAMLRLDQFAAMNIMYSRYSLDYFLDSMQKIGYKKIEFWGGTPHYIFFDHGAKQQKSIKKKFRDRNLDMICFTPEQCFYPVNIAAEEKMLRERSVEYFFHCIEDASGFDCSNMLFTSGWGDFDKPRKEAWKRSEESLDMILKKAELEGITILYEILQESESNLVTNFETLKKMIEGYDSDNLKCCLDTVPLCCAGETLEDYFSYFGEKIDHIHLNDGTPSGHMAWGEGTQDLKAHLDDLEKNNFRGYITFETCETGSKDPNDAFRQNLNAVKRYVK